MIEAYTPWQDNLIINGTNFRVPAPNLVWPLNLVYLDRKQRTRLWTDKRAILKRDLQADIITCPEFLVADYKGLNCFTNIQYRSMDGVSYIGNTRWLNAPSDHARFEILLKLMNPSTLYAAQFEASAAPETLKLLVRHGFIAMLYERDFWFEKEKNFWSIGAIVEIKSLVYA